MMDLAHPPAAARGSMLAEVRRELGSQTTVRLLFAYGLLTGLAALLDATSGDGLNATVNLPYLFLPLLLCPVAAHRVLRDRDTGMADVLATTPLTRARALAARTVALLLLTPLAVLVSLPILYAASLATAPGAFQALLVYPAWALSIGTTAVLTGLVVGHLTPKSRRLGLGLAFGVVLLWLLFGLGLGETPNPPRGLALLRRLSPLSHALQAEGTGPLPGGPAILLLLPLTLAAIALAALSPLALGLQHASGWDVPLHRHRLALGALVALLVLGTVGLLSWTVPEEDPPHGSLRFEGKIGELWTATRIEPPGWRDQTGWGQGAPVTLTLELVGPPNGTVSIDRIELIAEALDTRLQHEAPATLVLDEVFQDRGRRWNASGGTAGTATAEVVFLVHPQRLFSYTQGELVLGLDGVEHRRELVLFASEWQVEPGPVLAATGGVTLPLLVARIWLPRRWNQW